MSEKRLILIISGWIIAFSLIAFTIVNFRFYPDSIRNIICSCILPADLRNFVIVISSGLLTSASVTFLITIAEYRIKRVGAIEDFCNANWDLMKNFYNLRIFEPYIPLELLTAYYGEISDNNWNKGIKEPVHEAEDNIKRYLWEHTDHISKKVIKKKHKKASFLDDTFRKVIEEQNIYIEEIMHQYIELAERISCQQLSNAYAKIDFLFCNKRVRKKIIYERIYEKQREALGVINNSVYHFKLRKGNNAVMIHFIHDIQNCLFAVKENENFKSYYMDHVYKMDCEIQKLLKFIYGEKNYKSEDPDYKDYCCMSRLNGCIESDLCEKNDK